MPRPSPRAPRAILSVATRSAIITRRLYHGLVLTTPSTDPIVPPPCLPAGPIIIGLVITAISIGFTLSLGALALSTMFIPMLLFSILTFGFFSSFAMMGVGIFMPTLAPLVRAWSGTLKRGWNCIPHDLKGRKIDWLPIAFKLL